MEDDHSVCKDHRSDSHHYGKRCHVDNSRLLLVYMLWVHQQLRMYILFKVQCTHAYIYLVYHYVSCNASLYAPTFCCSKQHIQKLHSIRGTVNAQTIVRSMHCPSIIITRSTIVEAPMLSLKRHRQSAITLEAHMCTGLWKRVQWVIHIDWENCVFVEFAFFAFVTC